MIKFYRETKFKDTKLGPLPKEWEVVRLGDVFEFSKKPRNLKINNDDLVLFIPMELISEETQSIKSWEQKKYSEISSGSFVFKNDIIIAKITPSFENGKQAILDNLPTDFGYATTEIWALHPKNGQVITKHLYNYTKIHSIRMNLAGKMEGSTGRQRLPRHVLENFKIPLPPLPEQRAIATVLSTVQQAKEKTDAVITATKELKKSLMKHLFCYGPVSVEEAENVPLNETEIGLVPEEWEVVRLNKVCETKTGGTPSRQNERYYNGDIPWVKSGELKDTIINFTEERITELGLKNSSAKLFPLGTLLMAMYGATVGKTAILSITASTNQAICAIFPNDTTTLSNEFLRYYFIFAREKLLEERYGGAQPNISQTIIRNTKIPLPPFLQQQKIASILSAVDEKIEAEENKKKALDELFKSLLNTLMTAKIRVNEL